MEEDEPKTIFLPNVDPDREGMLICRGCLASLVSGSDCPDHPYDDEPWED